MNSGRVSAVSTRVGPAVIAWVVVGTVSVRLFTFTPGQFALGLRVVSVGETGETIEYEHEDGRLLSDEASIKLRYVYDNTNPGTWDPVLVEAVTFHMAALVAYSITGSKSLQDAMQANFAAVLEAARGINAEEAPVDSFGDNPLFAARSSGWGA